jgi:hypothetical protein
MPPVPLTPLAYHAYLLRLWRTAAGEWRASLEDAHSGDRRAFASLAQLADFLAHETTARPSDLSASGDRHDH